MASLLLQLLPSALGLVLSPTIIAMGILFLSSQRGVRNALAFMTPFLLFYVLVALIVLAGAQASQGPLISENTKLWFTLAIGVLLLVLAVLGLRGKEAQERPRWMAMVESARPVTALGMGLVFAILNPNVAILAAGLATLAAVADSTLNQVVGAIFLVASSVLGLIVPIIWFCAQPEAASRGLESLKVWLMQHQKLLNESVLIVFGSIFTLRGLVGLLAA